MGAPHVTDTPHGQHGRWSQREDGVWQWTGDEPPRMEERPWRQQFAMVAIAMSTILVIPLAATGIAFRQQGLNRTADNRAAIAREAKDAKQALERERELRVAVTNRLKATDARNCRGDERQDAIIVSILQSVENPPAVITEAIDALEPPGEPDCPPFPPGFGP